MKRVALALLASHLLLGCANNPTTDEVGQQIDRGIHGQGRVTPDIDRSDDPYVKSRGGGEAIPDRTE